MEGLADRASRFASEHYLQRLSLPVGRFLAGAAFNASGTILFAWHYGEGDDQLLSWRVKDGVIDLNHPETQSTRRFAVRALFNDVI